MFFLSLIHLGILDATRLIPGRAMKGAAATASLHRRRSRRANAPSRTAIAALRGRFRRKFLCASGERLCGFVSLSVRCSAGVPFVRDACRLSRDTLSKERERERERGGEGERAIARSEPLWLPRAIGAFRSGPEVP